jgi:hypothetical protein
MTPKQDPALLEFGRTTENAAGYMTITKPWGVMDSPVTDPVELELEACAPGVNGRPGPAVVAWRWAQVMADLEGLIAYLGALRPERKNLVIVSERWQTNIPIRRELAAQPRVNAAFQMGGRARGSFELPKAVHDLNEKCRTVKEAATGVRSETRRRSLIDLARDANVALYFISPAPQSLFTAMSMAKEMADHTDGLSLVSNDFYGGLQKMLDHQTGYYMLGYRPTRGPVGDRPRQIRVRTNRDGVQLDIQRLYRTPTTEDLARAAAPVRERTGVERAIDALKRIRDDAEIVIRARETAGHAEVTIELSADALRSRFRPGADVNVVIRDAAGAEVARADAVLEAGTRSVHVRLPLPAGDAALRATVRVARGDATVSEFVDIARTPASALGPAAVFRAGSLPRQPFLPAADLRFLRVERLRLEWPLAGVLTNPVVRVLNARGQERPADVTVAEIDESGRRLRADIRLQSLAPGDYAVEAVARAGDGEVRQLLGIRIVR